MKKSILFLINGYGVEQNDSIAIYSKELMPCLDSIISQNTLVRVPNLFLDYRSAYRKFSMGIDRDLSHSLVEMNIGKNEHSENQLLKYIANETVKKESNLHIFTYIDSYNSFEELCEYIKVLKLKMNGKIFVHLVLSQKSLMDYKDVEKGITFLTYEMGNNIKVGIVSGESSFNDLASVREIVKSFLTETGEKWKDYQKKLDVFISTKMVPFKARPFAANYGYRLEDNDQILFFNYSNVSVEMFKTEMETQRYRKIDMSTIGFYSLFPIKCGELKIPFMYNYALASTCFLNSLKSVNARCLVLDKKANCSIINYYLTGLRNSVDDNLKYVATDDGFINDPIKLVESLKTYDKELIIINYEIDSSKTVEELKERLNKIDNIIGHVYNYCIDNNIALFISSLYGMTVDMYNKKAELCKINLYSKVPFIMANTDFSSSEYSLQDGNLFDVANTILFTVNNTFPNSGLLKKKSKLFSLFQKKKAPAPEKIKYNNYDGVIEKVEAEADPHVVLPNQPSDQHHVAVQQQPVQSQVAAAPETVMQQSVPTQQVVQPNTQVVQNPQSDGTNVQ